MDTILCDELIQEIFHHLPLSCSTTVNLVSKRWLRLFRSSVTTLSLQFPSHNTIPSLSTFLSHHPYLSSLSLSLSTGDATTTFSDSLLLAVSTSCPNLNQLRCLTGPVSLFPLLSLSTSCPNLNSLTITLSRPLSLHWLLNFPSLKHLSLICYGGGGGGVVVSPELINSADESNFPQNLRLEALTLTGVRPGDYGLSWLWRNCKTLKKLRFRSCEGVGDNSSFSNFIKTLNTLEEVELRTCRPTVDLVLLNLAENCISLTSLLVYDGGSKEGLLQFIRNSCCSLRKLDLRLPLDLDNNHLFAIAASCRELSSLRLQSCCLVTGEGLKTLGVALGHNLEELALINCDVIEREIGLLTTMGQSLRKLRKLDLSHNDLLLDKEFISMMASCEGLSELKLRGCSRLTSASLSSVFKNCRNLESVDMMHCSGIKVDDIELFMLNSPQLRKLEIEDYKVSDAAKMWAENKFVVVVTNLVAQAC